jgi:hypothetical protein
MFDFLLILPFDQSRSDYISFPFSIFYFNEVILSLKLKSFPFSIFFILTGHAVAEAQVIPFFYFYFESCCR